MSVKVNLNSFCVVCQYFVPGDNPNSILGECRRFPPIYNGRNTVDKQYNYSFPTVYKTQKACGEFLLSVYAEAVLNKTINEVL